jgi:dihydrofolate reductase
MRNLFLFNMVTLDGYFAGDDGDIGWHNVDAEFNDFATAQLDEIGNLLFGRVTYELMAGYWPTPEGRADDPEVADRMNALPKVVVSTTLHEATWENTRLVRANVAEEIAALKQQPGKDLAIFGSGQLAMTLWQAGLLDELRLLVNPVVLGHGQPLFADLREPHKLTLRSTRPFASGNVLLTYRTA